jgi:hypothetical protein
VGGAYIADVLEAASGLNLWREWAKLEVADAAAQTRRQEQSAGAGTDPHGGLGSGQKPDRQGGLGSGQKPDRQGGLIKLKPLRSEYAGIVLSLSKQEHPDTSSYDDPEIVYRVKKKHHAGLIVRSKELERVEELLTNYAARFADDFVAVVPPLEKAE